jgi:hypothetical protein
MTLLSGEMNADLHPSPESPYVSPEYIGGPLGGGIGAVEPATDTLGTIRFPGGHYSLQGFRLLAQATPDRAVYLWEAVK